jgi:hypothetical protein
VCFNNRDPIFLYTSPLLAALLLYPLFFALPLFILELSIDGYDEIVITIVFRLNRPLRHAVQFTLQGA